jgi:iron complex transport system substrate-binding protein
MPPDMRIEMQIKEKIETMALSLGLLLGLVLAITQGVAWAGARTKTVTDSVGRKVTFTYPVNRIIVTDDTIADAVRLFRKQGLVVGVEGSMRHRGYFPEMGQRPVIGNQWSGLNWEAIVALKPDVILMPHHPAVTPRVTAQAKRLNIPVLAIRWHYPDSMVGAVKLMGQVLGEPERAAQFIKWRKECIEIIKQHLKAIPPQKRMSAYAEVDVSGPIGRAAGKGMPGDETMRLAGLNNVCQFPDSKMVSAEWVMARNPDMIVMNDYGGRAEITGYRIKGYKTLKEYLRKAKSRENFKSTKAVQNHRFYVMNSKMRGSMHMIGALYLAKSAYPELFADIEPRKIHQEYFERWLGLPFQGSGSIPPQQTSDRGCSYDAL